MVEGESVTSERAQETTAAAPVRMTRTYAYIWQNFVAWCKASWKSRAAHDTPARRGISQGESGCRRAPIHTPGDCRGDSSQARPCRTGQPV